MKNPRIHQKGWTQRCQHSSLDRALSWIRVLVSSASAPALLEPLCPSYQCPCTSRAPMHYHLSNHDRWMAARDWARWTVIAANALALSWRPCVAPVFPLLFKTPSPPLRPPFCHLFNFIFLSSFPSPPSLLQQLLKPPIHPPKALELPYPFDLLLLGGVCSSLVSLFDFLACAWCMGMFGVCSYL